MQQLHGAFVPNAPVTMVTRSLSAWQCAHGLHPSHLGWEPVTVKIASSTLTKGSWQLGGWWRVEGLGVCRQGAGRTLAKLAVKSTHSKSCPILWRNSSTCGRFSTYTCRGRRQQAISQSEPPWAGEGLPQGALLLLPGLGMIC